MKEGIDIGKRLKELAGRADRTGCLVFTDFLNMHELAVFATMKDQPEFKSAEVFGGADGCERCMIRFGEMEGNGSETVGSGDTAGYGTFPIDIIKIAPVQAKFADDLTHRDFLGSLVGLGIEREKTGDIIICDNTAYAFVCRDIAEFVVENLEYVKHTHVKASVCNELPEAVKPRLERRQVIVSSNRIDAVISKLYNLSREQSLKLVSEGRVFVNGAEIQSNSKPLKEGDTVSVRGFGKWIFRGESGKTRKDRLYVEVDVYV
ncbi:MAG: hypothetical protein K6E85_04790 [Lachnospiraceae bacterium]|nr:hypothetical protein [Lachnospiraceae bacterium]